MAMLRARTTIVSWTSSLRWCTRMLGYEINICRFQTRAWAWAWTRVKVHAHFHTSTVNEHIFKALSSRSLSETGTSCPRSFVWCILSGWLFDFKLLFDQDGKVLQMERPCYRNPSICSSPSKWHRSRLVCNHSTCAHPCSHQHLNNARCHGECWPHWVVWRWALFCFAYDFRCFWPVFCYGLCWIIWQLFR